MKIVLSMAVAFLLIGCGESSEKKVVNHEATPVVKEEVKKNVAPVVYKEVIKAKVAEIKNTTSEVVVSKSGKEIFNSCKGCHGANAEKSALNKSQVIKGWKSAKISTALNGYKDGSYGGAAKGMMVGVVKKLSNADVKAVSEYISTL